MDILFDGFVINCTVKDFAAKTVCTTLKTESEDLVILSDTVFKYSLFGGVSINYYNLPKLVSYQAWKRVDNFLEFYCFLFNVKQILTWLLNICFMYCFVYLYCFIYLITSTLYISCFTHKYCIKQECLFDCNWLQKTVPNLINGYKIGQMGFHFNPNMFSFIIQNVIIHFTPYETWGENRCVSVA